MSCLHAKSHLLNVGKILTHIAIPLDSGADLFRSRGNCELGLTLQTFIQSLLGQRGCSAHVLIAGVGTAADQT